MRKLLCWLVLLCCFNAAALAESAFSFLPTREHDGVTYQARPPADTTSILLIGYDHDRDGELPELHGYSNGGQADFLLLVVLDHQAKEVRMLQIDRDTNAVVRVTASNGRQHERSNLPICLAHAYGDTREKNNANTVLAVETLLGIEGTDDGAGIDYYIAMDISGISRLNDLLGGVTVTLQEDMTALDPQMEKGATLTLTGDQAEIFCRGRWGLETPTNAGRMARQRQYMTAAGEQLRVLLEQDAGFADQLLDGMGMICDATAEDSGDPFSFAAQTEGTPSGDSQGRWVMTSASRQEIATALVMAASYTSGAAETLPGEFSVNSNGYHSYYIEDDAALKWALKMYYR